MRIIIGLILICLIAGCGDYNNPATPDDVEPNPYTTEAPVILTKSELIDNEWLLHKGDRFVKLKFVNKLESVDPIHVYKIHCLVYFSPDSEKPDFDKICDIEEFNNHHWIEPYIELRFFKDIGTTERTMTCSSVNINKIKLINENVSELSKEFKEGQEFILSKGD